MAQVREADFKKLLERVTKLEQLLLQLKPKQNKTVADK